MPRAREQLMFLYKAKNPATQSGFEDFLSDAEKQERPVFQSVPVGERGPP